MLEDPTNFTLSSVLEYVELEGNPYGGAYFSLSSQFFNLSFGSSSASTDFSQSLSLSGILDPGTYTLRVFARIDTDGRYNSIGSESGRASYRMNMGLTPVPIPASVWLFVSGIGLLFGWKRKQQVQTPA